MKKECEETRKALPKYLQGHVFRIRRGRIERHLGQCVICRSEFEALQRTEETRQILRDINASEGVVGRVKDGVFALGKLKKLFYRPLWIAGIALAAAAAIYYLVTPHQLALEIDSIVKSEPTSSAPTAPPGAPAVPASVTRPSTTFVQPPPAASAVNPKTKPRPVKSPPGASAAPASVTRPSTTFVQPQPAASAVNSKTKPRPVKSPPAPRPVQQLVTTPSETAVPASPEPEPSQ